MNEARNTSGQAYALTVLTPIIDGSEASLTRRLHALESPLAAVAGTHFARWVVIGDVVYQGKGRRDHLRSGRLLFTSNFDGSLDDYLEALRTGLGAVADQIWNHCDGYPGHADPGAFAGYLRAHQLETSLFFAAYGDRTVGEVRSTLEDRRRLISFALDAQGLRGAALQAAFEQAFA